MPDPTSPTPSSSPSGMDYIMSLIKNLRGGGQDASKPASAPPTGMQLDGYRLHVQEAKAMGEKPMTYDEWIKQQPPLSAPQE